MGVIIEFAIHTLRLFVLMIVGVIYIPLNLLIMKFGARYQTLSMKNDHPIVYWGLKLLFFPFWLIVVILSKPYEKMAEHAH